MFYKQLFASVVVMTLAGCGGSGNSETTIEQVETLPEFNGMTTSLTPLSAQSNTLFERHLKNGVYMRGDTSVINYFDAAESSSQSSSRSFSSTITQEQGVDEGDKVKYDGKYVFIARNNQGQFHIAEDANKASTSIRIMQRANDGQVSEVNEITVNEEANNIDSLYLNNDVLAVISNIYSYDIAALSFSEMFFGEQKFNLSFISVEQPDNTEVNASFTVDGSVIDSRRVGNTLYVVSTYAASMNGLPIATTDDEKLANYNQILSTDINALLPKYTDAQGTEHTLVDADNCYAPQGASNTDGFYGIVTITAIDLTQPDNLQSVCANTQIQGLYATPNAVYLYGTDYQITEDSSVEKSVIHKFAIQNQQIDYRSSGVLDGRFNWNLSNLRFSEQGDYLRVVTTAGNGSEGYSHTLNVMTEDNNELTLVSQLPNDLNPTLIGKVEEDGKVYEDIKAVRYYDDKAYIVTFLNKDPLYVIDLSDNSQPQMRGALEIPGYSSYLHPISDDLLLGIGQNVDPNRIGILEDTSGETSSSTESPIVEGAKVSLFDISNPDAPREIKALVFENGYTPVEYDYHALTYLAMADGSHRFALPIERWGVETIINEEQQKIDTWYKENEMVLLEISSSNSAAELNSIGKIAAEFSDEEQNQHYYSGWDDRGIFHDNDIYYIHGGFIWRSHWDSPETVLGPF